VCWMLYELVVFDSCEVDMEWKAEWNEIDISKGMISATFTGSKKTAKIILDSVWYVIIVGNPCKRDYDSCSFLTLAAAKKYLRQTQAMPPYTRFKAQP